MIRSLLQSAESRLARPPTAAVAWNLTLGATYGLWAAFLPEAVAREIYGAPDAVVAGALRPSGRAGPVDGGFVVDGRWSFASGIRHSA